MCTFRSCLLASLCCNRLHHSWGSSYLFLKSQDLLLLTQEAPRKCWKSGRELWTGGKKEERGGRTRTQVQKWTVVLPIKALMFWICKGLKDQKWVTKMQYIMLVLLRLWSCSFWRKRKKKLFFLQYIQSMKTQGKEFRFMKARNGVVHNIEASSWIQNFLTDSGSADFHITSHIASTSCLSSSWNPHKLVFLGLQPWTFVHNYLQTALQTCWRRSATIS